MTEKKPAIFILSFVFVATLASAIMLVYSKHLSRQLFVDLQQLKREVDELNTEWGQLQLEQSAWSDHGRIERVARDRLSMQMPGPEEVVFIKR